MSTPPVVRDATSADLPALSRIDRVVWEPSHTPGPAPSGPFDAGDDAVLVVAQDDEVVGYVQLGRASGLRSNAHVRTIDGLAVDPAARGRGHARRLLAAAAARARAEGATRLRLRVLGTNTAGIALYESLGYVVEGALRDEFVLDGAPVDDVLMALRLDA